MAEAKAKPLPKQNSASKGKKKKRKRPDWLATGSFDVPFLLLVIIILTIGVVMLFSASYTYAYYNKNGDSAYFFKRQLLFAVIGVGAMLGISKVKYEYFKLVGVLGLPIAWLLLIIVLILPARFGDFHRWIYIGGLSFQPSEIAKLVVILFCAWGIEFVFFVGVQEGDRKSVYYVSDGLPDGSCGNTDTGNK